MLENIHSEEPISLKLGKPVEVTKRANEPCVAPVSPLTLKLVQTGSGMSGNRFMGLTDAKRSNAANDETGGSMH